MNLSSMTSLKGRRIRLTKDVVNKQLDRRSKYDVNDLPFTEGDVYRINVWQVAIGDQTSTLVALDPVFVQAAERRPLGSIQPFHKSFAEIVDSAELLPESGMDLLHKLNAENMAEIVLNHLYRANLFKEEDVAAIVHETDRVVETS